MKYMKPKMDYILKVVVIIVPAVGFCVESGNLTLGFLDRMANRFPA